MKNIIITILVILVLGLGGYLVYDKALVKEEKNDTNVEDKVEEKTYTYKDVAGNYYYEQDAGIKEMPGLMDHFGLILDEDGTFSYGYFRDGGGYRIIGNYMIDGNIITLNYIAASYGGGIEEILDKTHTLIINEDKSITDENVDLDPIFTSKITLSKDEISNYFQDWFDTFDQIVKTEI